MAITKSGIDRLGLRLKGGEPTDEDLRALDTYRKSFESSYESVVSAIRNDLKLEPTGRPAKSTTSVIDKLRRESIRLSQMQDIAGCRVIVQDVVGQDRVVRKLRRHFPDAAVINRRRRPSHGYRAVHVIVYVSGKPIEIQVRSRLQHLWAEVSERLSDSFGAGLKYGRGPQEIQQLLKFGSSAVADVERFERQARGLRSSRNVKDPARIKLRRALNVARRDTTRTLQVLAMLPNLVEQIR